MAVAISAIGAAAAAFGTEAFIGLAATAVADTGLALSVVGAVTGSKDLMKAGAVLGIAGGVAGLANSAFGSVAGASLGTAEGVGVGSADGINAMDAMSDAATTGASTAASSGMGGAALTDASQGMQDLASSSDGIQSTADLANQTGQATGGTPELAGAGGNAAGAVPSGSTGVSATPGITSDNAVQGDSINALDKGANYGGIVNGTRSSGIIDSIKDIWGNLSKDQQAVVLRAALAVPGGIQAQQNKARELALQAAKVKQTSYGSAIPSFTIPRA